MTDVLDRPEAAAPLKVVGTRPVRPDGVDKVTGKATYGADFTLPGMLVGRILRSPHAHARIVSIDTKAARSLPGVKAVITAADLPDLPSEGVRRRRERRSNLRDICHERDGAAQGALRRSRPGGRRGDRRRRSPTRRWTLIVVTYDVLPHVIDVEAAMAPDAPVLHAHMFTDRRRADADHAVQHRQAERAEAWRRSPPAGPRPRSSVEGRYTTAAVHQGYIEPHATLATFTADGQVPGPQRQPGPVHGPRHAPPSSSVSNMPPTSA